jgi:glycine oxidase
VGGEELLAAHVVLAAGAWSASLEGIEGAGEVPVRPVKGQIMRLRDPAGAGLIRRVLRFATGYLLPRGDGRYVLGATVEERGFDTAPTAGAAYELLRDARELVPGISELEIDELGAGLRPGTPDNAPLIGPGELPGLIWASGHYRNGILLAPLTAELVVGLLDSSAPADAALLASCAPNRFAGRSLERPAPSLAVSR